MNMIFSTNVKNNPKTVMRKLLIFLPLSLATIQLVRMRIFADFRDLAFPLLDVGCGDGIFWGTAIGFDNKKKINGVVGIDINVNELNLARERFSGTGIKFIEADITKPINAPSFKTIMCSSTLEHVSDLKSAIKNIKNSLHPNGRLILFVPSPNWTNCFLIKKLINKISPRLGASFDGILNGLFRHYHLYPHYVWSSVLENAGLKVIEIKALGSRETNKMFSKWFLMSTPAFFLKVVFKRYPVWFSFIKHRYIENQESFFDHIKKNKMASVDLENPYVLEYFIVCKK